MLRPQYTITYSILFAPTKKYEAGPYYTEVDALANYNDIKSYEGVVGVEIKTTYKEM